MGGVTAQKASDLATEHNFDIDPTTTVPTSDDCPEIFQFHAVSDKDVKSVIMGFASNKAPGYDKVSVRVLKDSVPAILPAITTIMNNSFNTKTFARSWKIAEVTPIPKSGDSEEPCNHRPISLLPVLSKVSERLAHRQFVDFLSANEKLAKTQSGNRKLHSTETALLCVTDDLLRAMDDKKVSVIVLLDMSKAFDSIRHDILLQRLHELGISSPSLDWFHSYLTDRYQRVRIHDSVSELLTLKYGVPQGSILGPVLFTIHVSNLLSVPEHCKSACYVDDSKLYLSFPYSNINTAIANLNEDLNNICSWCCRNSLLINPDKTKVLFIGVPQLLRRLPTVPVSMLGIEITPVAVAKDLGIYIDQSLTYNDHVTKTASNCLHKLIQINRIKHLLDRKTLILLMNCFVFSKLLYCSTVWSNTSRSNIKKLQLVQNFAARIVLGLRKFDHISQGIRSLNWLSVCDRLYLNDAIMIFKCIHNLVPRYLAEKFIFRSQTNIRNTRQSNHLNILRCRLATGQRSFSYRGAKLWNNLSDDLKNENSVKAFKLKLTKQLLLT